MTVNWTKMTGLLTPKTGNKFALIFDFYKDDLLLINLEKSCIVYSDSDYIQELYAPIVEAAHGDVLLFGFGLGFMLLQIMNKPEVTSVTVVEKEQEIIDLCASPLKLNNKVRIILHDALTYEPDRMFDFINDDCDYKSTDFDFNVYSYNEKRLQKWLKPNGKFSMNWRLK